MGNAAATKAENKVSPIERFNEWKDKPSIYKMGNSIAKSYNIISFRGKNFKEDQFRQTCLIALWKCCLNFDQERKVSFTTYLYNGLLFELCAVNNEFKNYINRETSEINPDNFFSKQSNYCDVYDYFDENDTFVLKLWFEHQYTLAEIGKILKWGCSENVRLKLNKIFDKARKNTVNKCI